MLSPIAIGVVLALIVVTGGAVRLTDSGLGCPTWPNCTKDSFTTTKAMGIHGLIEYGNRTLTSVVSILAVAAIVVAWRALGRSAAPTKWSFALLGGVAAQALLGGVTVRMALNPWIVGAHFLLSMVLLFAAYGLVRSVGPGVPSYPSAASQRRWSPPAPPSFGVRALAVLVVVVSAAVLVVGTMVTGSGPHSGDAAAGRNGLDPLQISQVHADLVFLLLGLAIALALMVPGRAPKIFVAVLFGQGLIGFVQYFTGLPVVLVGAHMLGACLVWIATLAMAWPLLRPVVHVASAERSPVDNLTVANASAAS
jgi:cytochrome c oxidase assembly protein subunit 15